MIASPQEKEKLHYLRGETVINLLSPKHANAIVEFVLNVAKNADKILLYDQMYEALSTQKDNSNGLLSEAQKAQLVVEFAQLPRWISVDETFMGEYINCLRQPEDQRSFKSGSFLLFEVVNRACEALKNSVRDLMIKPELQGTKLDLLPPFIEKIEQHLLDDTLSFKERQSEIEYELKMIEVEIAIFFIYQNTPQDETPSTSPQFLKELRANIAELKLWVHERQILY